MYQFWQIHVITKRNPSNDFDKSNNLDKIQQKHGLTDGRTDKARQWLDLGPIKAVFSVLEKFKKRCFFFLLQHVAAVVHAKCPHKSDQMDPNYGLAPVMEHFWTLLVWTQL